MSQGEVITIMQDAIYTTIMTSLPVLLVAIVIGLVVSIFQATTQINEQTLAFVPKIIGIFLALLLFGNFMMGNLQDFTIRLFESINVMLR
ncbi:MAG: flagellar biosynthesis protein FliQ [Oscillospiraceae bacterium]|jgi:flagellar biosynthetic protein FliQ|nr:flagellar biosynthesis protein FliQ [Oscillospiraceae bacterium]